MHERDVRLHVLTALFDALGRVRPRLRRRREALAEAPVDLRGEQLHQGIDRARLEGRVGRGDAGIDRGPGGLQARVGRTLPLAVHAHERLEEESVRKGLGLGAERAHAHRVLKGLTDLAFLVGADPLEDRRDVLRLEGGAGILDHGTVQRVAMGEGRPGDEGEADDPGRGQGERVSHGFTPWYESTSEGHCEAAGPRPREPRSRIATATTIGTTPTTRKTVSAAERAHSSVWKVPLIR